MKKLAVLFSICASVLLLANQRVYYDAWNDDHNISDRNITTKIVNREFNLTIASINSNNDGTETKDGIDAQFRLYDMINDKNITNWQDFNSSSKDEINASFKIKDRVYRNVRVNFRFCQKKNDDGSVEIAPFDKCDGSDNSYEYNTSTYSSDEFAIRPYKFMAFGANTYKKAGLEFNLTIKATDEYLSLIHI
jgi:hypothetical protein